MTKLFEKFEKYCKLYKKIAKTYDIKMLKKIQRLLRNFFSKTLSNPREGFRAPGAKKTPGAAMSEKNCKKVASFIQNC